MIWPVDCDDLAFLDLAAVSEKHRADGILFQVKRNAVHAAFKFKKLRGLALLKAVNARNTVADLQYRADALHFQLYPDNP